MLLDTESELAACESKWRELAQSTGRTDPFVDWDYVWHWWEVFGRRCPYTGRRVEPLVLQVYGPDGNLVAIFPFVTTPVAGRFGPRVLRLFGHNGTFGPEDPSEMPLHLVAPGSEALATQALVDTFLNRLSRGLCDGVLAKVSYEGCVSLFSDYRERLERAGTVVTKERTGEMVARLPSDWRSYLKALTKSMRDNTKYYPKLLERGGHRYRVYQVNGEDAAARSVDEVVRLHRLRARSERGSRHDDHLPTSREAEFLRTLVRREAAAGRAFLAFLEVDGQTIAGQVFFRHQSRLYVYYSGFDPAWFKFSPITVLQADVFRRGIESGEITELGFFLEDAPWKDRWGALPSGRGLEVFLIAKTPVAVLRASLLAARRAVMRSWRSIDKNIRALRRRRTRSEG